MRREAVRILNTIRQRSLFRLWFLLPTVLFPYLTVKRECFILHSAERESLTAVKIKITVIDGGTVINAVPGKTVCTAEYGKDSIPQEIGGCTVQKTENGFEITGQSAHGSRPELGRNTVTALLEFLACGGCEAAKGLRRFFLTEKQTEARRDWALRRYFGRNDLCSHSA